MKDFVKPLIDFLKSNLFGDFEDNILVFTNANETLTVKVADLAGSIIVKLSYEDNGDFYTIKSQEDIDDIIARINEYID